MKPGYQKMLQEYAKQHGLRLLKVWNVIDAFDLEVAKLAIVEARKALEVTSDQIAYTVAMTSSVAVEVKKLPNFKPRRFIHSA